MKFECLPTDFYSRSIRCSGWLFLPKLREKRPVIIMAHDLGAIHDMRLDAYAQRFAEEGFACFLFDYRNFGASAGGPRQAVNVRNQLIDWQYAIEKMKQDSRVNGQKIYLFGTSFSGGHVMSIAAERSDITGVIAQSPYTDNRAFLHNMNKKTLLKLGVSVISDWLSQLLIKKPYTIKFVAPPGEAALMAVTDYQVYLDLVPRNSLFKNQTPARSFLTMIGYSPGRSALNISCPIYYAVCQEDKLTPVQTTLEWINESRYATVKEYPCGQFDLYTGAYFEEAMADYVNFYKTIQ